MVVKMRCPICGNEEFFYIANPATGNRNYYTVIPTGTFSSATANRYVCTYCGFLVEKFEVEGLKKIADKYGR